MRCSTARRLISDQIDGLLGADRTEALERHLETCADCRRIRQDFRVLVTEVGKLESPAPPERAWAGIVAGVSEAGRKEDLSRARRETRPGLPFYLPKPAYALAAFLALAVVIGGAVIWLKQRQGPEYARLGEDERYALVKLDEAQHHYELAIKALNEAVSAGEQSLDPRIVAVFRENLEAIDSTIDVCRRAILEDSYNLEARTYLLAAYRDKVIYLNEFIAAGRNTASLTGMEIKNLNL